MTKRAAWLIGFATFTSLVVALIVIGWATHSEPTLDPDAPAWSADAFPLEVCARSYRVDDARRLEADDRESVEEAVSRATGRLGGWALAFAGLSEECDVEVLVGVPSEEGWRDPGGHSAIAHRAGVAETCRVETSNTGGPSDLTTQVVYHELGHCLGLLHDDFSPSIMQPTTRATPDRTIPDWFTDDDVSAIRERYGR